MKASIIVKVLLVLPFVLIADYVIMIVFGCTACRLGFRDDFYCGPYCLAGEAILLLSAGLFIFMIFPELKLLINYRKNAKTD
jgi:hypothetical protein